MKNQRGYTTLIIMLAATAVFVVIGFFILRKNSTSPAPQDADNTSNQTQEETEVDESKEDIKDEPVVDTTMVGWNTYTNAKYGYSLQYPPNLKAGSISGNSVLGTYDAPVKGFDVGPLVFITLSGELRKSGADYFNSTYSIAQNPPKDLESGPSVECKIDNITNPNASVRSVSCTGEGGPARYALITGPEYDIFVDGYSKGFDETNNGELSSPDDYIKILNSFKFPSKDTGTQNGENEPSDLTVQSFSVNANEASVSPDTIIVKQGTIVNLTVNVSSQTKAAGGLTFKSSVANSGTIVAGASKTIAFTVKNSFEFMVFAAADNVELPYKLKIVSQ